MKLIKVFSLFGAAILPHLAFADAAPPQDLGAIKAMLDYCSQIDPKDAGKFGKMWASTTERETSSAPTSGFQVVYDSTMSRMKGFQKSAMLSACHTGASRWTPPVRPRPTSGKDERPTANPGHRD